MNEVARPEPMGSESEIEYTEVIDAPNKMSNQDNTTSTKTSNHQQQQELELVNNNKPIYDKWKINFQNLLEDESGYKTFYEFLETEQISVLFECWHSCVTYRKQVPDKSTAKEIYSRFARIKDSRVPISDQARNNLAMNLRAKNDITDKLLLEIENEVYSNLRDICYPKFLKSDFFTFYCETFGQLQYEPSNFHKFGKPNFGNTSKQQHGKFQVVEEDKQTDFTRISNDLQEASLTPNEKERHLPCSSSINSELQSYTSNAFTEEDRQYMADTRIACGSNVHESRTMRGYNHDQLPDLPNFKPRTQRMNHDKMKPYNPADLAAILTKKLEKVIQDRSDGINTEKQLPHLHRENNNKVQQSHSSYKHYNNNINNNNSYNQISNTYYEQDNGYCESDAQSMIIPPATDRYSVAGASSHSGSGANVEYHKFNRNHVKEKAKGLFDAVHQSLRNGLGECNCQACFERKQQECLFSSSQHPSIPSHSSSNNRTLNQQSCHSNSCHCSTCTMSYPSYNDPRSDPRYSNNRHNTQSNHMSQQPPSDHHYITEEQQDIAAPIDTSKIYAWLEKNEKLKTENPNKPLPSPAIRRKKQQTINDNLGLAGQPIAQDPGMPLLPQPDTGNVLEEVKRVLEEPNHKRPSSKVSRSSSSRSHPKHQQQKSINQYYQQQQQHGGEPIYNDRGYDNNSMASGSYLSYSDTQSSISYNPSQISTVPSSASRLWNENGYYDPSYLDSRRTSHPESRASHHGSRVSHHDSRARSEHESRARSEHDSRAGSEHNSRARSEHESRARSEHNSRARSEHESRARSEHNSQYDQKSDVRSHSSTGRKSHHSGSLARSDHQSNVRSENQSDVRSQSSTGRTQGSDNSKTRNSSSKKQTTTVTYFFGVEPIPYRIIIPGTEVTLGQFKAETKKGNYRFFFKTIAPDDGETVYEEIRNDEDFLPKYKDRIIGKVEKIE